MGYLTSTFLSSQKTNRKDEVGWTKGVPIYLSLKIEGGAGPLWTSSVVTRVYQRVYLLSTQIPALFLFKQFLVVLSPINNPIIIIGIKITKVIYRRLFDNRRGV